MTNIGESHDMCHEHEGGRGELRRTEHPRQSTLPPVLLDLRGSSVQPPLLKKAKAGSVGAACPR